MKNTLLFFLLLIVNINFYAQTTHIPDNAFEQVLIDNGWDDVLDDYVLTTNINTRTYLNLSNTNVSDLTGLDAFSSLSDFYCSNTNITTVTTLPSTTGLATFVLEGNSSLTNITFPSTFTSIGEFSCADGALTTLDVNNIIYINFFYAPNNQLTSLDFSNTRVDGMTCSNNPNITSIDMRNGADYAEVYNFNALNNPNLTCVFVDDVAYATTNWTNIDATTSFVAGQVACDNSGTPITTNVPDTNFEHYLETHHKVDGSIVSVGDTNSMGNGIDADGLVTTANISSVTGLYINNLTISSLTGIEGFTSLVNLRCDYNQLSSLDLTGNTNLETVNCNYNQLTSINVTANAALTSLKCRNNQLSNLDISQNTSLYGIRCQYNAFTSIDFSQNTSLNYIYCDNNQINVLDLSQNSNLSSLKCNNNNLTSLATSNLTNLEVLFCDFNQITTLDLSLSTALYELVCSNNQLTSISLPNTAALESIKCQENLLTSLDVTNNTGLLHLECGINQISNIDVSNNTLLVELLMSVNPLTSLDVSSNIALTNLAFGGSSSLTCSISSIDVTTNTALTDLSFIYTQITNLDASQNTNLVSLYCANNQLETLNVSNGNNTNFTFFNATSNSFLNCIQVDDIAWSTANWSSGVNGLSSFSEDCHYFQTYVPDTNFEQALIDLGYDTTLDDYVLTANINSITSLVVNNKDIEDLTGIKDFTALVNLQCMNNSLTSLDCTGLGDLEILYCNSNQISNLSLLDNVNLVQLYCGDNALTSIDNLYNFNNLNSLNCPNNQISDLNIGANTALLNLHVEGNQLANLDVSNNTLLTVLNCNDNQLSSLDISNNTDLFTLRTQNNQITSLDVSNNPGLSTFLSNDNLLTSLDMRSGNNTHLSNNANFNALGNANLTCIFVDDVTWSTSNWTNIDTTSAFVQDQAACDTLLYTNIPDANFETYLETHNASGTVVALGASDSMGNGVIDDHAVLTSRIENVTILNVNNQSISDLTGVEIFTALTTLNCSSNNLTVLDVSTNINLGYLRCGSNSLTTLNTNSNINLTEISCYSNDLTTLDLSANTSLINIACYSNNITTLNVNANSLTDINCSFNSLTSLDLSANTNLISINCVDNNLTALDVSTNTDVTFLNCSNNNLTSLDISANTNLTFINCADNNISTLDLSNNSSVEIFNCSNNNLTTIKVQNGLNFLLVGTFGSGGNNYARFRATGNPNLTCVFVDNATDALADNAPYTDWEIDATATYVQNQEECDNAFATTNIPDTNFETYLETHNALGDTVVLGAADSMGNGVIDDNTVFTSRIENVTNLNVNNQSISDLTGLEDFIAVTSLKCYNNDLTDLNISANTNLTNLTCLNNNLSSLDVSANTSLTHLYCGDNSLSSLDVSANTSLTYFSCSNNAITDLDVSTNTSLKHLYCMDNNLTTLDISTNTSLIKFNCSNNDLTILNAKNGVNDLLEGTYGSNNYARFNAINNPNLTCVFVDNAADALAGNAPYTDWEIDATATYVQNQAECDTLSVINETIVGLSIYPNPVKDKLHLTALEEITQVSLFNMLGQEVIQSTPFNTTTTIDMSTLSCGSYFIKVGVNNKIAIYAIIKK